MKGAWAGMSTGVLVALISAAVAVCSAVISGETRAVVERLDLVSRTLANTSWYPASAFRLYRDEQRAVGEIMLEPAGADARQYQCIGYAAFVTRLEEDPRFARWFSRLDAEAGQLASPAPGYLDRAVALQGALIDVIEILDPQVIRLPRAYVKRLNPAAAKPDSTNATARSP